MEKYRKFYISGYLLDCERSRTIDLFKLHFSDLKFPYWYFKVLAISLLIINTKNSPTTRATFWLSKKFYFKCALFYRYIHRIADLFWFSSNISDIKASGSPSGDQRIINSAKNNYLNEKIRTLCRSCDSDCTIWIILPVIIIWYNLWNVLFI